MDIVNNIINFVIDYHNLGWDFLILFAGLLIIVIIAAAFEDSKEEYTDYDKCRDFARKHHGAVCEQFLSSHEVVDTVMTYNTNFNNSGSVGTGFGYGIPSTHTEEEWEVFVLTKDGRKIYPEEIKS